MIVYRRILDHIQAEFATKSIYLFFYDYHHLHRQDRKVLRIHSHIRHKIKVQVLSKKSKIIVLRQTLIITAPTLVTVPTLVKMFTFAVRIPIVVLLVRFPLAVCIPVSGPCSVHGPHSVCLPVRMAHFFQFLSCKLYHFSLLSLQASLHTSFTSLTLRTSALFRGLQ